MLGFGGHGIRFFFDTGRGDAGCVAEDEVPIAEGEGGEFFELGEKLGGILGVVFELLFEFTGDEGAGHAGEEFIGEFSFARGNCGEVEDELAVGEEGGSDESAVEVVIAGFDTEEGADEFGEIFGGIKGEVDDSADVGVGDFLEGELASKIFEDVEVGEGEVDVPGGEGEGGGAIVLDFVIEVPDAAHERVEVGLMIGEVCDGCGLGFFFGEGFVGVGLFFDAVAGRGDEDEDDEGHDDEDEATGEG